MTDLNEAFALLEKAQGLEAKASMDPSLLDEAPSTIIDGAADKMFEACYQIKQHLRTLPQGDTNRQLLENKFTEYEHKADLLRQRAGELKVMELGQNQIITPSITAFDETHLHSVNGSTCDELHIETQDATLASREGADDNAATIKAKEAEKSFAVAISDDENENYDQAIDNYVKAAGQYLKAVTILSKSDNNGPIQRGGIETSESPTSSSDTSEILATWKKIISGILDRVEVLKKLNREGQENVHRNLESNLTSYELDVLVRSSLLTSGVFLPWSDKKARAYDFSPPQKFVDPDGKLDLSPKQKETFYRWARPEELMPAQNIKMIDKISPYTIKQHCVSDCSFIAGLCISAANENRREGRRLVSSLIYPQDSNGTPIYNPSGVYMVKLWLNGVARRVVVDDYLPVDTDGNLLCSHTAVLGGNKNNLELWVPILEKAYMKMCGGYDFPGSNSGVDLFSLTGWIPEKLFLPEDSSHIKDFETPIERCWERLFGASSSNDCLITLATSKDLTEAQANAVGLHTDHAYAVLKIIKLSNGNRFLQLKNPWGRSGWNGNYTAVHDVNFREEVDDDPDCAEECDSGVFWITWTDVTIYLRNIHVSWNPELLPFRKISHALWKVDDGPIDDLFYVSENPQYIVTLSKDAIEKKATLWVLLSRHGK